MERASAAYLAAMQAGYSPLCFVIGTATAEQHEISGDNLDLGFASLPVRYDEGERAELISTNVITTGF